MHRFLSFIGVKEKHKSKFPEDFRHKSFYIIGSNKFKHSLGNNPAKLIRGKPIFYYPQVPVIYKSMDIQTKKETAFNYRGSLLNLKILTVPFSN
jgi:hypothetical protein